MADAGVDLASIDLASLNVASLAPLAFAFALVVARVGSAMMLLPVLGEAEVPATVRAGFTLALVLLLPVLLPLLPVAPSQPWVAAGYVVAEVVTGLWLGWLTRLVMLALTLAGEFAALATGLANVLQPDPALGVQTAALGRLFGVAAPVLILASGLHALPLAALVGSYRVIPAASLLPAADTAASVVSAVGACFALALRLAAPFLAASLIWHVALGLLSRLVPQLQISAMAAPIELLGGLLLLTLLAGLVLAAWQDQAAMLFAHLPGH